MKAATRRSWRVGDRFRYNRWRETESGERIEGTVFTITKIDQRTVRFRSAEYDRETDRDRKTSRADFLRDVKRRLLVRETETEQQQTPMQQPRMNFAHDVPIPSVQEAQTIRDRVIPAVAAKATKIDPRFVSAACAFIEQYLRDAGPMPGEDLTDACKKAGIIPADDRHFGAVYWRLRHSRVIEKVGSKPRRRGHYSAGGNVWALTETARGAA